MVPNGTIATDRRPLPSSSNNVVDTNPVRRRMAELAELEDPKLTRFYGARQAEIERRAREAAEEQARVQGPPAQTTIQQQSRPARSPSDPSPSTSNGQPQRMNPSPSYPPPHYPQPQPSQAQYTTVSNNPQNQPYVGYYNGVYPNYVQPPSSSSPPNSINTSSSQQQGYALQQSPTSPSYPSPTVNGSQTSLTNVIVSSVNDGFAANPDLHRIRLAQYQEDVRRREQQQSQQLSPSSEQQFQLFQRQNQYQTQPYSQPNQPVHNQRHSQPAPQQNTQVVQPQFAPNYIPNDYQDYSQTEGPSSEPDVDAFANTTPPGPRRDSAPSIINTASHDQMAYYQARQQFTQGGYEAAYSNNNNGDGFDRRTSHPSATSTTPSTYGSSNGQAYELGIGPQTQQQQQQVPQQLTPQQLQLQQQQYQYNQMVAQRQYAQQYGHHQQIQISSQNTNPYDQYSGRQEQETVANPGVYPYNQSAYYNNTSRSH